MPKVRYWIGTCPVTAYACAVRCTVLSIHTTMTTVPVHGLWRFFEHPSSATCCQWQPSILASIANALTAADARRQQYPQFSCVYFFLHSLSVANYTKCHHDGDAFPAFHKLGLCISSGSAPRLDEPLNSDWYSVPARSHPDVCLMHARSTLDVST